jgi:hypothetical protein
MRAKDARRCLMEGPEVRCLCHCVTHFLLPCGPKITDKAGVVG